MFCQVRNLMHYLNDCYPILYPKGISSGTQAIDKTSELLLVMAECRNTFYNA